MTTAAQIEKRIKDDPAASYALRCMMGSARQRDPLDALRDAQQLLEYCQTLYIEATAPRTK